ncbi:MAG: NAD-dependent epimerase/dehydratase family protein [Elusimicrobia bacterium]|nr:NAD-dependent epimerase/dehydratase family protein [Elusimicrobiota bacterium]
MKILVTGGAGFIGSHIVDGYIAAGYKVAVIDNLSSGKKENINPKAKFYKLDINSKEIEKIFFKEKFDLVNHHAAQIDVRKSVQDPMFDAEVNIVGALNIFESSRKSKVKKVIFASSGGTIYGECGRKTPDEKADANPLSPYGIAKYSIEFYLKYFLKTYGLNYTILRYGNVYGPRQDPHGEAGVVAIFSGRMLNNEKTVIFGNGNQMRDYVYVGDVARANIFALKKGNNEIINIGTGKASSVNELFKKIAFITDFRKKPVYKPARAGELYKSVLDIKKAKKILKWEPSVSLKSGLEKTVKYFENWK